MTTLHDMAQEARAIPRKADEFLAQSANLLRIRGQEYDKRGGERSMGRAVTAFNTITGKKLTESEGWLLLQVLKDVRQWTSPHYHVDSAEDAIAYSALKAESLEREHKEHESWQETSGGTRHTG
jgi:hypothetical protein